MPGRGRPFQRGESGNPGGRPRVAAEVQEFARQHGPEGIARLITLMRSDNEPVALRAAEALLDRAYGRPPQAIAVQAQRPLQIIITDATPPVWPWLGIFGEGSRT
jgi:hypothetical protein